VIDECQNLFAHEKYGRQAADDAAFIIKIGPAFGIMLDLATQRPTASRCPRRQQQRRSAILLKGDGPDGKRHGTRHRRLPEWHPRRHIPARGRHGRRLPGRRQLAPQVIRTYYLDLLATERVAKRARALREAAGTLFGVALG
jgi:S-DNA-T family DNA segregation ATPase FtsK/SpoIIIE